MNERNLSRSLSTSIVDALKAQGHILVVKGGATALARELEELMLPSIAKIAPRAETFSVIGGEVTSTFGSEAADDAAEDMVEELTDALMDSDHVEDVFAEDNVIRRDIFRALREGLARPAPGTMEPDETQVVVKLDTLGYVAATVTKLCEAGMLREALGRAANAVHAHFTAYSAEAREATFTLEDGDPDGRLSLEEAIADELTDLVEHGAVELPTIERTIDMPRALNPIEQRLARGHIDAIAKKTLLRTGCAASWELDGPRLKVIFTPLSEQDAREVDDLCAAFGREVGQWLGGGASPAKPARSAKPAPTPRPRSKPVEDALDADLDDDDDDLDDEEDLDDDDLDDEEEDDLETESAPSAPAAATPPRRATKAKAPKPTPAAKPPKRSAKKTVTPAEPAKAARPKTKAAPAKAAGDKRAAPKTKKAAAKKG